MRTLVLAFSAILLSVVTAFSQTQTVRVGYAVITPSAPTATGMVAQETFLQTREQDTLAVGVFPPVLMTNAIMPVDRSVRASTTLGVAFANPNAALASVTLTLRRSDGTLFSTSTFTISGRRQISRLITELFPNPPAGGFSTQVAVPAEFTGTLLVNSTIPISIVGLRFRGQNFSTTPVTDLAPVFEPLPAIISGVGGLGAVMFPQFVVGGGWSTEFVIINTTSSNLTIRLDVFTTEGTALNVVVNNQTGNSFTNLLVPANGVLTLVATPVP
jgi:hypothetical protein